MPESSNIQKDTAEIHTGGEKTEAPRCLNCNSFLLGDFCHCCGQRADVKPFNLKILGNYLYQSFRKFDGEVRSTFFGLLFYPGRFCRRYLEGHRKPFADPVKFFFLSFVLQATVFGLVRYISQNPQIDEAAKLDTQFELVALCMTIFWAVGYTLAFRKGKYNLAENIVCLLFITAEARAFSIVIQLALLPFATVMKYEDDVQSIIGIANTFAYFVYFSYQFYRESFARTMLKNLLVLVLFLIACIIFFLFGLFATLIGEAITGQLKV